MQAIIFDFGNVVGFFSHHKALEKLRQFSPLQPHEMYAAVYSGPLEDQFERGLMTSAEFLSQVRKVWQLSCDDEMVTHAITDIFWSNTEVCEIIPRLKGRYRVLLGSNTNPIHSHKFLDQFADVLGHFDALVLSHDIGVRKPHADFFRSCHERAGVPAEKCVFIDDLAENIAGARAFGFQGIVYQPNADLAGQLRALGVEISG
jgi:putative hydrolase of the HAD superfamily